MNTILMVRMHRSIFRAHLMSKLTSKPCSLLCNNFTQIEVFKLICVIHERERDRERELHETTTYRGI